MQETMRPTDKDYWKHIVTSSNLFGVDLFKTQAMENPSSNVIISPTAVYLMLSLIYNGAAGSSAAQLAGALRFPQPEEINPWNKQLLNYLTSDKPEHEVAIAFALWFGKGLRCHEGFVKNCMDSYGSAIYGVDFDSLESNEQINYWAQTSTGEKIHAVVEAQKPLNGSSLAVTNVFSFYVPWQSGFDARNTSEMPFWLVGGGSTGQNTFAYRPDYITPVNEANLNNWAGGPVASNIVSMGQKFATSSLLTKLQMPEDSTPDTSRLTTIFSNASVAQYVGICSWHNYDYTAGSTPNLNNRVTFATQCITNRSLRTAATEVCCKAGWNGSITQAQYEALREIVLNGSQTVWWQQLGTAVAGAGLAWLGVRSKLPLIGRGAPTQIVGLPAAKVTK